MDVHAIQLHNTFPEPGSVDIQITSGNCGKFDVGDVIHGTYVARDPYFGSFSMHTLPSHLPAGILTPAGGSTPTPAGGSSWTLDTSPMQECGYVVQLVVSDRAVSDSQQSRRQVAKEQGFCLD